MKTFLPIILFLLAITMNTYAQNLPDAKRDHIWVMGTTSGINENRGGIWLDFSGDSLLVDSFDTRLSFYFTNGMICDTAGQLAFYSNGLFIANAENEIIENGFGLNPGPFADDMLDFDSAYNLPQGALALPKPNHLDQYYLFHSTVEYPSSQIPDPHVLKLLLTEINMNKNDGLGKVLKKNKLIVLDTLPLGELTSVRHANGLDWWLILGTRNSNKYYRLLIKGDTIIQKSNQIIGDTVVTGLSQAVFSPNGNKYVRFNTVSLSYGTRLDIFDFNRCSGKLSNPIQFIYNDSAYSGGVAISPNSRFLYVPSHTKIFQYDLEANDIEASRQTVAVWDTSYSPNPPLATTFYLAQLAPDGKIYINSPNSVDILHVIHNPNELGLACNVEQRAVQLPAVNIFTMPNYPNFRLGASAEPCIDSTTSIKTLSSTPSIPHQLFPNPANDFLYLALENPLSKAGRLLLYNGLGQQVLVEELEKEVEQKAIDLVGLQHGLYYYVLEVEGKKVGQGKVVKYEE